MIKKLLISFTTMLLLFTTTITAYAKYDPPISVRLNGKLLHFDQRPVIENGTTLVPFRTILEALGASVEWNEETKTIICRKNTKSVIMQIGSKKMTVDKTVHNLDVPPKIINNRTLIPLRAVSQAFDAKIEWDSDKRIVDIDTIQPTHTDITYHKAKNTSTESELNSIINQITQKRYMLSESASEEFVVLLNQINAFKRTVKNYGNITDTDKLTEIQSQYGIYIKNLKTFAAKNGIALN